MPHDDEQPKNRGGRPRAPERRAAVATWLPSSTHDQLIRLANARSQSVSAFLRELVVIQVTPRPKG